MTPEKDEQQLDNAQIEQERLKNWRTLAQRAREAGDKRTAAILAGLIEQAEGQILRKPKMGADDDRKPDKT